MSSRSAQRLVGLAASAAAVVALAACSSDDTDTDTAGGGGETETVTIGTLRGQPHFYAPFLYEQYAEEGVEFEVVILDSTPSLSDALVSGTVDFAVTGVTSTISSIAQDRDLKIIASAADGGWGFLGNDISGVSDLVGKKVGYVQGSAPEVALRLILEEEGIDPASLELVAVPPPELASALGSGSIDAFFGVEIGVSLAEAAGGTEIADPYSTAIGQVNIGLATSGEFIQENPELVQKVVDTHEATTEYMSGNVEEWLPDMVAEFGGDEEVLESALENFTLRSDLSQEYLDQVEVLAGEMADLGLIDSAPTVADIVDDTFAPTE